MTDPSTSGTLQWQQTDPVTSTGVCPFCHRYASPITRLYAELTNTQASWQDAVFWTIIGAVVGALVQVPLDHLWAWVTR